MVAVKKLLQPMPNFLKQFKNEIDLLVKLKHPNIVRLIGYCYETQNVHMDYNGKFIFAEVTQSLLCLEFLPKGSLDRYISGIAITYLVFL
jgi:serine/threonine protein kinase